VHEGTEALVLARPFTRKKKGGQTGGDTIENKILSRAYLSEGDTEKEPIMRIGTPPGMKKKENRTDFKTSGHMVNQNVKSQVKT